MVLVMVSDSDIVVAIVISVPTSLVLPFAPPFTAVSVSYLSYNNWALWLEGNYCDVHVDMDVVGPSELH